MGSDIRPHVNALTAKGFWTFPLMPGTKTPAVSKWLESVYVAEEFEADHNVAISTGQYGKRWLVAVDVDNKKGVRGEEVLAKLAEEGFTLPETFTQQTPTGGRHLIYVADGPVKCGVNVLGPGVDIRGKGGYLVAAGSSVPAGTYTCNDLPVAEAPAWLLARCRRPSAKKATQQAEVEVDQEKAKDRAERYLAERLPDLEPGRNHAGYQVACRLKDIGLSRENAQYTMVEQWQCDPPLDDDELEHVVRSAYTYGTETPGCRSPEAHFPNDGFEAKEAAARKKYTLVPLDDLTLEDSAVPLIEDWINRGELSVVYGPSGAGKSFFVIAVAVSVASGRAWLDKHAVDQGGVAYCATENAGSIKRRLMGAKKFHGLKSTPIYLVSDPLNLVSGPEDARDLAREIKERKPVPKLIVIDTCALAMPGADENSAKDVGIFIQRVKALQATTGAHVMLVHHAGKDVSRGARGSSSLRAAVDVEIRVTGKNATITKQRDGDGGKSCTFTLENVRVGGFGREVQTSVAVVVPAKTEEVEAAEAAVVAKETPKKSQKLPTRTLRLLAVLEDLLDEATPNEDGEISVPTKNLRREFCLSLEGEVKPRSMETTFSRELGKLKDCQYITVKEGRVFKRALKEAKA